MGKLQFGPALSRGWQIFVKEPLNMVLGGLIVLVLSLTVVLAPAMMAGQTHMARRVARGEKPDLGDVFHGFGDFGRYFVGGLIFLLVMVPAYLLYLASPGLGVIAAAVIMGILIPFWPLMVVQGLGGQDAFRKCLDFYRKEYLAATIIALLFTAMFLLAVPTLLFTLMITIPLTASIVMACYELHYGQEAAAPVREAEFEDMPAEPGDEEKPGP